VTITFRGQDLLADGLKLNLTVGYAEPVSVRGTDTTVPSLAGRIARGRVADVRSLRIEGYIAANTAEEWRAATDTFSEIFDTRLGPGVLQIDEGYLGLPDGDVATINARTLNAVGAAIQAGKRLQFWSIELESVDPDWVVGS
jgi:hypothetical protein